MRKMPEVSKMETLFDYNFSSIYDFKLNFKTNYGFIRSLCVKNLANDVIDYIKTVDKFENIVQVGIGGSALGATASYKFFNGIYTNKTNQKRYFVLDNIDPERLDFIFSLDLNKTFFHVVSKSGQTIETLSLFFIIYKRLKSMFGKEASKHVVITTSNSGFLYDFAIKNDIKKFFIPNEVGGRFSVFTPVGLIPISFLGKDIELFIEGAKTAVRAYRNGWNFPNDFVNFSIGEYKNKKNILVMFAYKDSLYGVADWFRQLWAESLGKDNLGQTPIKALGVTDQHSQIQLYKDGSKDKAIIFMDTLTNNDYTIEEAFDFTYLLNKSISTLMNIEKQATYRALMDSAVPCGNLFLNSRDEFSLGALYISLMIAAAKAGEVLGIDAFNQPGVELGKKYTKQFLMEM
jgi:glucose-6-phosphate isomerase